MSFIRRHKKYVLHVLEKVYSILHSIMMNFLIKGPILLASCTHNSTLLWFSISFYSPRKMWTLTPTKISPHRKTWTLCHCMHCLKSNCICKCSSSFIDSFWGKPFVASEYNSLPPVSRLCCSAVNYDLRLWLLRTQGEWTGILMPHYRALLMSITYSTALPASYLAGAG